MTSAHVPPPPDQQLANCTYCPKMCRHACPVATTSGRELWTPHGKLNLLAQLRQGLAPWTTETTDALWACTDCRHCSVYCEHGNEPGAMLLAGRAEAQRHGVAHPKLADYGERFIARQTRLAKVAQGAFAANLDTQAELAYFPGCDGLDKNANDVAAALAVFEYVLRAANHPTPKVTLLGAPINCGGYPLLAAGLVAEFAAQAARVAAALAAFRTVIVNCSACLHAMRASYAAHGIALVPEIVSTSEFLARYATHLPTPTTKRTLHYHDPCHLARHEGVLDAPRQVLGAVSQVREFAWHGADTECCGGAGLLPKTDPPLADAMARRRLTELQAAGGGTVVTSCSTCSFMLKQNAPASVAVRDLPTAIAELAQIAYATPAYEPTLTDDE